MADLRNIWTRSSGTILSRFGVVVIGGLILDISVSWSVSQAFGWPLWLSATLGFCVAASGNYLAHEFWTFTDRKGSFSPSRALSYVLAMIVTLGTRLAVIACLSPVIAPSPINNLAILLAAAGLSFLVHYIFSRFLIFRPQPEEISAQKDAP